jgi:hypothetical protein
LRESIDEVLEKERTGFLRLIALSTAVLAAFAAVATLQAGATVNEALVLKTEATAWQAAGKQPPAAGAQAAARYAREQEGFKAQAEAKERERDGRSHEADRLLARHHGYANSVALFQIAIALGAVAALTQARSVWTGSILVGLRAIVLFTIQMAR